MRGRWGNPAHCENQDDSAVEESPGHELLPTAEGRSCSWLGGVVMGKFLFSLAAVAHIQPPHDPPGHGRLIELPGL